MDELVEEFMEAAMGGWMACSLCGAGVEVRRMRAPACNVIDRSNLFGSATEEDLCLRRAGIPSRLGRRP